MGTLTGDADLSFLSLPPFLMRSNPKGKTLLLLEQILFKRVDLNLEGLNALGKQTGSHKSCLPL